MNPNQTTLERAFELAQSGDCRSLAELRLALKAEGHSPLQIEGPMLRQQLRSLIDQSRRDVGQGG